MQKTHLIILVIAIGAMFTSCKKDWTCTCSDAGGEPQVLPINNTSRADAEAACSFSEDLWDECSIK